jgi:DNA polymerase sliding clamp subunit (PCNA homolog)
LWFLQFQDNKLEIKADATQVGQNSAVVPVKYKGNPIRIAFNYRFLLDFLNSVNKDEAEITIKMNSPESPVIFEISNDTSLLHLIMPIRTEE